MCTVLQPPRDNPIAVNKYMYISINAYNVLTLRTGDADFRLYITTVQNG